MRPTAQGRRWRRQHGRIDGAKLKCSPAGRHPGSVPGSGSVWRLRSEVKLVSLGPASSGVIRGLARLGHSLEVPNAFRGDTGVVGNELRHDRLDLCRNSLVNYRTVQFYEYLMESEGESSSVSGLATELLTQRLPQWRAERAVNRSQSSSEEGRSVQRCGFVRHIGVSRLWWIGG